ncbi:MAG TPA: NAD(P)H-binding protein [Solirubrobacteraceae bacterium]|nr:NAD(P)H-binding protein [Solirubrobacteraceae bacterium]
MARCLIIGCGCRGLALTRALRSAGHAVRATTRDPGRRGEIEAAGAEVHVGDPDRVATLAPALDHVGVACLLLGSAAGTEQQLTALHSTRLDMLLERMLDTTIRGIVYEAAGSVPAEILNTGTERVRWACERSLIPYVLLTADPGDHTRWTAAAAEAVQRALLAPDHRL